MKTLKLTLTTMILLLTTLAYAQEKSTVSANGIDISIEVVDDAGVALGNLLGEYKKGSPPVLAACCVQPERSTFTGELISKMQTIANFAVDTSDVCDKAKFNRRLSALLAAKMQLPANAVKDGKSTLQIRRSDITQVKILACLAN